MFLSLRKATLGLILVAAATALLSLSAQAADPLVGTWELNLEKSKFNPGPPPKSKTRTYEVNGLQEKMIASTTDAQGNTTIHKFSATRDGKEYPYEGWPMAETVSLMPVDASSVTYSMKTAGKVVVTGTRAVSNDGKMLTISVKFTTAKGQEVDNIEVFDKR